jgi:hypothetical protein
VIDSPEARGNVLTLVNFLDTLREHGLAQPVLIGGVTVSLYLIWRLCRLVVAWGYFAMFFFFGAMASWALMPHAPVGVPVAGGLTFASAVSLIRVKIMKVVGAAAVLGAAGIYGQWVNKQKKVESHSARSEHTQPLKKPANH